VYESNHLAQKLRAASLGREDAAFLENHQTGETVTYGAFFANAERMAAVLVKVGVKPGDRVAVQAPKTQAMLELYVGAVLAGAVFLPLNSAYTGAELEYFLSDAEPSLLVCDPARLAALTPIAHAAGVGVILTIAADEQGTLSKARDAEEPGFEAVTRGTEDLAAILYTSGTTGRSKGAMLTHRALASNSETLKNYWHFTSEDVLIHALPVFHTHGLFVATNITLMAGSSCIFMAGFDAGVVRDYMAEATALMGVPTFYERRAGTVGFPLPGVEVIVTDTETGKEVPHGEAGILEVRGPNVFAGYWRMPEKTAEELRDNGFFITGDIARINRDGYVSIVGRAKDLIITGGYNVYPKEVESLIDAIEGVVESAVIGVPHKDFGEAVVAVVVPKNGAVITPEVVQAAIAADLARFKQPKRVIIIDALPRNSMGKVQKNELREQYNNLFG